MEIDKTGPLGKVHVVDDRVFEQLFKTHFPGMHAYASTLLRDGNLAEEIVQTVFAKLYEKAGRIRIEHSLESYLYRSVYYESLNHRKHEKVRSEYRSSTVRQMDTASSGGGSGTYRELEARLQRALNELPEGCRTIFQLSRFEGLKYRDIANRLGLSVKTVENQMGKALRVLREKLKPFLSLLLLLLFMK